MGPIRGDEIEFLLGARSPDHTRTHRHTDLDGGKADSTGSCMYEQGLASAKPCTMRECDFGSLIHEARGSGLFERHRFGHREYTLLWSNDERRISAERQERADPVPRVEAFDPGPDVTNHSGHLTPGCEGKLGPNLILPLGDQDVEEVTAHGFDFDGDLSRPSLRFFELFSLEGIWAKCGSQSATRRAERQTGGPLV